ncbi:MAG: DNA-directed RNA polymerase subunit omega [Lachnospiraceae bacterium]|jgi:DNA-directed RNA polymerase subunit omega|nr:DNA-directed RNA polymerase subunit omega [Lachnospiraceae bacterium]
MIHPSYAELSQRINENAEGEHKVINSRYSICIATAKRARQLIDGAEPYVIPKCNKPLSIAIQELYEGKVNILPDETVEQ